MNEYVKDFIENNLQLIKEKDWKNFFTTWSNNYGCWLNIPEEKHCLDEIFEVLTCLGVSPEETKQDRVNAIKSEINEIVTNYLHSTDTIEFNRCLLILDSYLGLTLHEIKEIFIETCNKNGLLKCNVSATVFMRPLVI